MNIILEMFNNILRIGFSITKDWGISIILLTILLRFLLLPLSFKQRMSILKQGEISKKIEETKIKYKNDKAKLDEELMKHYKESSKSMFGCFTLILQLPILSALYYTIQRMPADVGTILIPWVSSLKLPDRYFIVPLLYSLISVSPNLISYIGILKPYGSEVKNLGFNMISMMVISIIITIKAPVSIGIYFIASGVFTLFEEIAFRLYQRYLNTVKA
ncbi:membrane protein insertase, YidC/Oxa1 family, C-terminal domain-containing protein [Caloramator quimbayensis]|uniref:Membrane protein insertase, YidC/Oxa1 family, C-terminal domain-containing protein n=1 Tax=Caloramator quimbayensis TaxID=1147123 RepID=A0A1T4WIY8_9CLOT|nr:membrane protein insertase YidC [Caloramator quimbayensis]SKA77293.1 membrane protein insertase, YidC/Oxa1 family, C-terminal domain-containing protein [Caloramator quimbayensis]